MQQMSLWYEKMIFLKLVSGYDEEEDLPDKNGFHCNWEIHGWMFDSKNFKLGR